MKTKEANHIPPEVRDNMRYTDLTEAVVKLGLATIELTDELVTPGFSDAKTLFLTSFADGKIGELRQKLLLLETASTSELFDEWLGIMREKTEKSLEPVAGLIAFAREDKPKVLVEEYAEMIAGANWALENLYRLWGLPLPEEDEVRMLESGHKCYENC